MTKEERTNHAMDISNRYVSKIHPEETETMAEISKLPIQDIITIYSNANYAFENGLFHDVNIDSLNSGGLKAKMYVEAIERVKHIIINRLKAAEQLWTVTDKITQSPYIDDINHVWIFTEKELADGCVDYYMQQYRTTFEVTEIKKDDIIKFFGQTAYLKGAECFRIDMGAYAGMVLKPDWLVEKPDFTNTPFINRPIMNPDFFRAVAKFQEERCYRGTYEGKAEKLRKFENDMIKAFHDATFLIPVKGMDKIEKNPENKDKNGEIVLPEKTTISIPILEKHNGEIFTPVFTDWEEFNKVYSKDEWGGWIWRANDLRSVPNTVCLNYGSLCFEMPKDAINWLLKMYNEVFFVPSRETIKKTHLDVKVPHSPSYQVLREIDGKMYLASFVFFYTAEEIRKGEVGRPTKLIIADIVNGDIVKILDTKENDFSEEGYDKKYNIRSEETVSEEYHLEVMEVFDDVRKKLLNGAFDKELYDKYLDMVVSNTPKEYRRFYHDLSFPGGEQTAEKENHESTKT